MSYRNRPDLPIETAYGSVKKVNRAFWWVPADVSVTDPGELQEHEDVVELPYSTGYYGTDGAKLAELWGALVERFSLYGATDDPSPLPLTPELLETDGLDLDEFSASVPLVIAREQKPVIAGYLRAHGISAAKIGRLLDVSESTVEQYVSDVRNGKR